MFLTGPPYATVTYSSTTDIESYLSRVGAIKLPESKETKTEEVYNIEHVDWVFPASL